MSIFVHLEGFRHGSLLTLGSCHIGVGFSKLHFEHPGEDLGFLSSAEALPQLRGLSVIMLVQSKQVRGQIHHSRVVFVHVLTQQSLHANPPYPLILVQRWKEPHGGTSNELFIDLAKMPQGFPSHNLVGVAEAKPDCGHIPGFSDVGELLTLANVDGDLTSFSAMLHVLVALILRTILDFELLQGGIQDFGETLGVQAVTANPNSCHPRWVVTRKA
jgi:hypothetical protein